MMDILLVLIFGAAFSLAFAGFMALRPSGVRRRLEDVAGVALVGCGSRGVDGQHRRRVLVVHAGVETGAGEIDTVTARAGRGLRDVVIRRAVPLVLPVIALTGVTARCQAGPRIGPAL